MLTFIESISNNNIMQDGMISILQWEIVYTEAQLGNKNTLSWLMNIKNVKQSKPR